MHHALDLCKWLMHVGTRVGMRYLSMRNNRVWNDQPEKIFNAENRKFQTFRILRQCTGTHTHTVPAPGDVHAEKSIWRIACTYAISRAWKIRPHPAAPAPAAAALTARFGTGAVAYTSTEFRSLFLHVCRPTICRLLFRSYEKWGSHLCRLDSQCLQCTPYNGGYSNQFHISNSTFFPIIRMIRRYHTQ